ncbi:hypothetical protein MRX96_039678 [Rhipicephalus microplus]
MLTIQVDFLTSAAAQREDDELKHLLTATIALNIEWIPVCGSKDRNRGSVALLVCAGLYSPPSIGGGRELARVLPEPPQVDRGSKPSRFSRSAQERLFGSPGHGSEEPPPGLPSGPDYINTAHKAASLERTNGRTPLDLRKVKGPRRGIRILAGNWHALIIAGPGRFPDGQGVVCLGTGFCSGPSLHTGSTPESSCFCLLHQNVQRPLRADLGSGHPVWVSDVPGLLT